MTDAVLARERIAAQIEILRVIEAERTDRRLEALGYATTGRRRWPQERDLAGITGRRPASCGPARPPYLIRPGGAVHIRD